MKICPTCQVSYPNNYAICPADGSSLSEVGSWSDGSVIRGKYRILAKVGQGGMGSVYKALHLAFDELRALKVIAPELLSDELFVKRFKHEAVITRRLQHPNAVRVDDIDESEDGRPYIVMEFIEGKSLKKLIREEGPLPAARVCSIIKQCSLALDAAHRLGMVHRDIKPDNIALVDAPDGEMVKVLDFGIAKVKEARMGDAGGGLTLTGAGVVIGTPQYMSPEQAMGKRGDELDGRADLYSLGVVMYQMLTADLPFKADTTMEMLLAHMQKPPTPMSTSHPEVQVPEALAALTMRLLEKNRDLRPASAKVLIQEIEKIEKDGLSPGRTRVLTADDLMNNRGQMGGGGSGGVVPPRPQPVPQPYPQPVPQPIPQPQPQPRPVEPPRPLPIPPRPQPQVISTPRPKPPESRWGVWAGLIVLFVGLGGLGLYFATRPNPNANNNNNNNNNNNTPVTLSATLTAEPVVVQKGQSVTLRWSSQNATDLDIEPDVGKVQSEGTTSVTPKESTTYTLTATGPGGSTQSSDARVSVTEPVAPPHIPDDGGGGKHPHPKPVPPPPPPPPDQTQEMKGKKTMGEFHLKRGEYDDAIKAFKEGLELQSPDEGLKQQIRTELGQTITACKKENSILNEGLKCGD